MKRSFVVFIVFIVFILLITLGVFYLDYYNVPTLKGFNIDNLNSNVWAVFTTFVAALFGGGITLGGVLVTIKENRNDQIEKDRRMVMPMIKMTSAEDDYRYKYIKFDAVLTEESKIRMPKDIINTCRVSLKIENLGSRELLDFHVCNIKSYYFKSHYNMYSLYPIIYSKENEFLNFYFVEKGIYDNDKEVGNVLSSVSEIAFDVYFKDCFGNWYTQGVSIGLLHSLDLNKSMNERALNACIERIKIQSAPMLVSENELPWKDTSADVVIC